jgi:hypothetical protein
MQAACAVFFDEQPGFAVKKMFDRLLRNLFAACAQRKAGLRFRPRLFMICVLEGNRCFVYDGY